MWEVLHAAGIDAAPRRAVQNWRQFLTAQAHGIIACDFLVVETVSLKRLWVLVFIEHGTRRFHLGGVTVDTLRFVVHDRDPLFTIAFAGVFKAEGFSGKFRLMNRDPYWGSAPRV